MEWEKSIFTNFKKKNTFLLENKEGKNILSLAWRIPPSFLYATGIK